MQQFYSPYVYAANNPISIIDPSGMWASSVNASKMGWLTDEELGGSSKSQSQQNPPAHQNDGDENEKKKEEDSKEAEIKKLREEIKALQDKATEKEHELYELESLYETFLISAAQKADEIKKEIKKLIKEGKIDMVELFNAINCNDFNDIQLIYSSIAIFVSTPEFKAARKAYSAIQKAANAYQKYYKKNQREIKRLENRIEELSNSNVTQDHYSEFGGFGGGHGGAGGSSGIW